MIVDKKEDEAEGEPGLFDEDQVSPPPIKMNPLEMEDVSFNKIIIDYDFILNSFLMVIRSKICLPCILCKNDSRIYLCDD